MYIHTIKKTKKTNSLIFIVTACILLVMGSAFALKTWVFAASSNSARIKAAGVLPTMKASELKAYDGTKPGQPIYIGFEGLVYDVTAGKKYYQKGGSYHFLAGKDSTADLRVVGGSIIKEKYPVVAKLAP
ncbi:MAG: cytochrome b5 domain-containing protein [Patescibacteria group bacterium]|nr:cytochrome b5 domain-containing protein [Patescibacteria group bacterium]